MRSVKLLLTLIVFCTAVSAQAQTIATKKLIASIENKFETDEEGYPIISRAIELPGVGKEDLFYLVQEFFRNQYGNKGIAEQDAEKGIVKAKNMYSRVLEHDRGARQWYINTEHEIHVQIADEFVMFHIKNTGYHIIYKDLRSSSGPMPGQSGFYTDITDADFDIRDIYPLGPHKAKIRLTKDQTGEAFHESYNRANAHLDELSRLVRSTLKYQ